ncbi:MAG: DUF3108 domain-containing protein [Sulfurimonas sp.]|nr:DUF3108 domain-containing protein [Sulfurimonas sp.]MDQ7061086.1 DUF3108 domain-containing protein [Sulfurimonas sp.]
MKYLLLILSLKLSLLALTSIKEVKYESGISIYGQIGYVELKLEENIDKKTYKIQATTTSIGLVKFLSSNRTDTFISEGNIKDGVYLPLKFTRITSKADYKRTRIYIFNYDKKTIFKTEITDSSQITNTFNPISMTFTEEEKILSEKKTENIDFATNDFLSLYLNLISKKLLYGKIPYVDMKEKDKLLYLGENSFEVHKNHGKDKYSVLMVPDEKSMFFKQVTSVGIAFYGDAYIKKISEISKTIN